MPTAAVRATVFALSRVRPPQVVGQAVISAEVRYATVALRGASRVLRRFASLEQWRVIEIELAALVIGETVATGLTTARLLTDELGGLCARLQRVERIEATPGEMVRALDALTEDQL